MDDVFAGNITTWKGLHSLRVPADAAETGRKILIKKEMRRVPVLRQLARDRTFMTQPVKSWQMQREIRHLGVFCGFEQRLVAYALRRGVAYSLAQNTSKDMRRFRMGHNDDSAWRYHLSLISTIDFTALFRDVKT